MRCSRMAEEGAWKRLGIRCEHYPVGFVIRNYAKSDAAFSRARESLLDDLVGLSKELLWDVETQRPGGLEVDD